MPRSRLDVALVERGLFPSRARAQAAVMAGRVRVDGRTVDKPGAGVAENAAIAVEPAREYVSRGGIKLANALDALDVDVRGACAIDLGASTGGFTDCLLQRGARRVIAVDVGYGQLDWGLRQDERVHVMERTNARDLRPELLPWPPDLATCDLSFISIGTVWGAGAALPGARLACDGDGQAPVRGGEGARGLGRGRARPAGEGGRRARGDRGDRGRGRTRRRHGRLGAARAQGQP